MGDYDFRGLLLYGVVIGVIVVLIVWSLLDVTGVVGRQTTIKTKTPLKADTLIVVTNGVADTTYTYHLK